MSVYLSEIITSYHTSTVRSYQIIVSSRNKHGCIIQNVSVNNASCFKTHAVIFVFEY